MARTYSLENANSPSLQSRNKNVMHNLSTP
jgi:hypothetical protein